MFNKDKDSLLRLSVTELCQGLPRLFDIWTNTKYSNQFEFRQSRVWVEGMTSDCSQPLNVYRQLYRNPTCTLGGFVSRPRRTRIWGVQWPPVRASVCLRKELTRTHQQRIIAITDNNSIYK